MIEEGTVGLIAATYSVDGNRLEMRTAADQIAVQFTRG